MTRHRTHENHLHRLQRAARRGVEARLSRRTIRRSTINTAPFERDELPRVIGDYEIVIDDHSYMPTDLVRQCKNLKHIVFLGTGAASYMNVPEIEGARRQGPHHQGLRRHRGGRADHRADVRCCRDLARMDRDIRAGTWRPLEGVQLLGKTLGIIGLGGIGAEVARIAKGIGMEVIAWNRTPRPEPACRWSSSTRCWRSRTSFRSISCSTTRPAASSTPSASPG